MQRFWSEHLDYISLGLDLKILFWVFKVNNRVCMGPGKPEQSWNFILTFSRTGKTWKSAQLEQESFHNLLYKKCMQTVRRTDFEILGMKEFQSLGFVSVKGYEPYTKIFKESPLGRKDVLGTSC